MAYTLRFTKGTTWRIYREGKEGKEEEYDAREAISQYYFHDSASAVKKSCRDTPQPHDNTDTHAHFEKSFPYHHCLMSASLGSSQKLIARDNHCYPYKTKHTSAHLAHIHDKKNITPFVIITPYQKTHLTCQSAMAGLLVSRLFGIYYAPRHKVKCFKKYAEFTARYTHSALASEYLIGYRYYYNLPEVLSEETNIVGKILSLRDATTTTYEKIKKSRSQLVKLYDANIDRMENAVQQFRRGLVSLESIREDPEFTALFEVFWLVQTLSVNQYKFMTSDMSAHQVFCESNGIAFERKSMTMHVCNIVFSCQVVCPRLFSYDIAHLFDDKKQSYVQYVKTVRAKQLQLSNEGLKSAFLAFSAIEPRMVSMKLAPHMEDTKRWIPFDSSLDMNHIQSRDEIFGTLLCKHRCHISRPAVAVQRTFYMTKNNKDCFYLSVQDVLEELRTGQKSSKNIWKKNKSNFMQLVKKRRIL